MSDLISRQAVLDGIAEWIADGYADSEADCSHISSLVSHLPSVENKGEDRPKGHWIESGYVGNDNYLFECSECHSTDTQSKAVKVNYCWHCGADMRGEADEDNH